MHCSEHTGDEPIDSITLMNEGHQRGNFALVVGPLAEVREYELLEGIDLILELHEVGNRLVAVVAESVDCWEVSRNHA